MQETKKRVVLVNSNPYLTIPCHRANGNGTVIMQNGIHPKKETFEKWDKAMSMAFLKRYGTNSESVQDITNVQIIEDVFKIGAIPAVIKEFSIYNVVLTIGIPGSGCELSEIVNCESRLLSLATAEFLGVSGKPELRRIIETLEAVKETGNKIELEYPEFIGIPKDARSLWFGDFELMVRQSAVVIRNELLFHKKIIPLAQEFEGDNLFVQNALLGDKIIPFISIESKRNFELVGAYVDKLYGQNFRRQKFPDGNFLYSANFKEGISYLKERFSDLKAVEMGKEGIWDSLVSKKQTCFFAKRIFDVNAPKLLDENIVRIIEGGLTFTLERGKVAV